MTTNSWVHLVFPSDINKRVGELVLRLSAKVPQEPDPASSLNGSWFLPPEQHGIEFIIFNLITLVSSAWFLWQARKQHPILPKRLAVRSLIDSFLFYFMIAVLAITVYYKHNRNSMLFLLQPCHVNLMILIAVINLKSKGSTELASWVFTLMLHQSWGGMLAFLFPDLRDYQQPFEVEFFWIEHILILAVPIYVILRHPEFLLPLCGKVAMASYSLFAFYHTSILSAAALWYGKNLNYLICPPPGPLYPFGTYYRIVMYLFCIIVTFATRFFIWHPIHMLAYRLHAGMKVKTK